MRNGLITEPKNLKRSFKLSMANIGLSQLNWKTVPQLGLCSGKTYVTKLVVSPSDDTRPRVGRTQPTSSLITDKLTVVSLVVN